MKQKLAFLITIIFMLWLNIFPSQVHAWRCDCSKNEGPCEATISRNGNWLNIGSSSPKCSFVVYYIDGEPKTDTVLDGNDKVELMTTNQNPTITKGPCHICSDKNYSAKKETNKCGEMANEFLRLAQAFSQRCQEDPASCDFSGTIQPAIDRMKAEGCPLPPGM